MSQARFQKIQREKARREKLAAKRERRAARAAEAAAADDAADADAGSAADEPTVLAQLAALHEQFDEGTVDFEEFEDRKRELLAQLDV